MKKSILFSSGMASLLGVGVFCTTFSETDQMPDLLMANIEALAGGEGSTQTYSCTNGIASTDEENSVFYCGSCSFVEHSKPSAFSSQGKCSK